MQPPSKEEVLEVLTHLDTDKSGKVDFEEFTVLIKDVLQAILSQKQYGCANFKLATRKIIASMPGL